MQSNPSDSDDEVFFGIPTKKEWQINCVIKGYPLNTANSCSNIEVPCVEAHAMGRREDKGSPCAVSQVNNSEQMYDCANISDVDKISDSMSLLCRESYFSDAGSADEDRSTLNQKPSEKGDLYASPLACAGIMDKSDVSYFTASSCSKDTKSASVSISSECNRDLAEQNSSINFPADAFGSGHVIMDEEYSTLKRLLKYWQICNMKKRMSGGKTEEATSLLNTVGTPNKMGMDFDPQEAFEIKKTQEITPLMQQAIPNVSAFDETVVKCHSTKKNISMNREIELRKQKGVMDFECQSKDSVRSNPVLGNVENLGDNTNTPPGVQEKQAPFSVPQRLRKMYSRIGNYPPQLKMPEACASRIQRLTPASATKRRWDVKSPVAQYIEESITPLVKVVKFKEELDIIEESAVKEFAECSVKKEFSLEKDLGLPPLPPARYCAAKTHLSPLRQDTQRFHIVRLRSGSTSSQISPFVTRHIGTSRVLHGVNYLANEESPMDLSNKGREKLPDETTEKATEMEQSVLEHASIVRSDTIFDEHK